MNPEPRPMKEVHRIMERLYEKRTGMTPEEIINSIESATSRFVESFGLKERWIKKIKNKEKEVVIGG
ncbi:MAG: hypothetical protein QME64_04955 [bacterium]|nr:hypothetical protein [bacterium]